MSLNEVNWQKVFSDNDSFPPDLVIIVQTSDKSCSIQRQKFGCHKLLLSVVSPYFCSQLSKNKDEWMLFNDINPEAFQKVIDFIYHKRPFKVHNGGLGSSFSCIKLVLEVLCLAVKFQLPKLVKFCEEVVDKRVTLTNVNSLQVQNFLASNKDVTLAVRNGILLKYKSVARRRLVKAGISPEKREEQLKEEMQVFATAVGSNQLDIDFNATSTLNQTARSLYYQEHGNVACLTPNPASRSMFQDQEEEFEEIVLDSSPPRMPTPLQIIQLLETSPPRPSSGPPISPLAASSNSHQLPTSSISLAPSSFLGCSSPTSPSLDDNIFDAYNNNWDNDLGQRAQNLVQERVLEGERDHALNGDFENRSSFHDGPRFASTPHPYIEVEVEPNPESAPVVEESSPTFEELVYLVKNISSLSSDQQHNLVDHIKRLERENPTLVEKIQRELS